MFRRRRKAGETEAPDELDAGPLAEETAEAGAAEASADGALDIDEPAESGPAGPFDEDDMPDDGLTRVDLGALRIPVAEGVEVRLEVDESGQLGQVLLVDGASMMQLGVFAAPRSSGIWDEVREEISASLEQTGGKAQETDGPWGVELQASAPTGTPGELAPARFIGIDRPRWFLRALLSGPAAIDQGAAGRLLDVLAGVVVVRGRDAMPIRDPLPLALPKEAVDAMNEDDEAAPGLEQLGPGPTITETR